MLYSSVLHQCYSLIQHQWFLWYMCLSYHRHHQCHRWNGCLRCHLCPNFYTKSLLLLAISLASPHYNCQESHGLLRHRPSNPTAGLFATTASLNLAATACSFSCTVGCPQLQPQYQWHLVTLIRNSLFLTDFNFFTLGKHTQLWEPPVRCRHGNPTTKWSLATKHTNYSPSGGFPCEPLLPTS